MKQIVTISRGLFSIFKSETGKRTQPLPHQVSDTELANTYFLLKQTKSSFLSISSIILVWFMENICWGNVWPQKLALSSSSTQIKTTFREKGRQ